jgi:hypothetical protein
MPLKQVHTWLPGPRTAPAGVHWCAMECLRGARGVNYWRLKSGHGAASTDGQSFPNFPRHLTVGCVLCTGLSNSLSSSGITHWLTVTLHSVRWFGQETSQSPSQMTLGRSTVRRLETATLLLPLAGVQSRMAAGPAPCWFRLAMHSRQYC